MKKHFFKQRKGITLIALIVTIVVLIILATISINAVIGEDGIIKKAEKTNILQSHAAVQEAIKLAYVDYEIEQRTGGTAKAEETKLASVETTIKLAEASEETFLEYLVRKGYADANGVINVKKLLGNSTGVGNGSGNTDIYKIEETEDGKYELNYYGEEGVKNNLWKVENDVSNNGSTEIDWEQIVADLPLKYEEYLALAQAKGQDTKIDIGIGTDGEVVNLKLWRYYKTDDGTGMSLGKMDISYGIVGYIGNVSDEGKIEGKIPQYIYVKSEDKVYPVTTLVATFENLNISEIPQIPSTVTSIGQRAFCSCKQLTNVTIPRNVTTIGIEAFSNCTGLTTIAIPDEVTNIGNSAFSNCTGLTTIAIPSSVTNIGNFAFSNCTGLTTIAIPSSVTNIGDFAFSNCTGLTTIAIPSSVTNIGDLAFNNVPHILYNGTATGSPWGALSIN